MRVILLSLLLVAQFGLGDWSARHTWKASWKSKPVVVMEDGSQLPTIDSIYASPGDGVFVRHIGGSEFWSEVCPFYDLPPTDSLLGCDSTELYYMFVSVSGEGTIGSRMASISVFPFAVSTIYPLSDPRTVLSLVLRTSIYVENYSGRPGDSLVFYKYASHGTLALPSGRDYFDSGIPDSWQFAASYPLSNLVQQSDNFISLNLPPSLVVLGEDIWLLAVVSPYVLNCTPPKTGNELRVANYGSECPNETKRSRLIFTFSAP